MKNTSLFFLLFLFNTTLIVPQSWDQVTKIVPFDRATSDIFGQSVSVSGDYAIVGAPFEAEDANGLNPLYRAGSAYIYVRNGSTWTQLQKIVASTRIEYANFGYSVAISGDYAIIGAPGDSPGPTSGSAYIFMRNGSTWTQLQRIEASDHEVYARFGYAVSIFGNRAIIGAYGESKDESKSNPIPYAGAAYIFELSGAVWIQHQKVVASDRASTDLFGFSVSIFGDYAIIGARDEDEDASGNNSITSAGSAYIFIRSGSTWTQQQKIVASDRTARECWFGTSVAISGNYAIVGAPWESKDASGVDPLSQAGSAYIFVRNGSTWAQQQKIVASDRTAGVALGFSVSISGDYAIVGAKGESKNAASIDSLSFAGAAYIFVRSGSAWMQQQKIVASDRTQYDHFGSSVSISGGYAIVGASDDEDDASGHNAMYGAGSAYIFNNQAVLGIELNLEKVPSDFSVMQNFPNPFNPATKIKFLIPSDNNVEIKVFNILGNEVATLLNEYRQAGTHSIEFDAGNLSSGIYYYQIRAGEFIQTKKMVLLR